MGHSFSVLPLDAPFGISISGLDLSRPLPSDSRIELRRLLAVNAIIVLRMHNLSIEAHQDFASSFGVPEKHGIVAGLPGNEVVVEIRKETDHRQNFGNAWHFDLSFRASPPIAAVLVARETPPHGGDTIWANQVQAFDALPADLVARIEGKRARHSDQAAFGGHSNRREAQTAFHPLIYADPDTGRRSLFINPVSIEAVDNMSDEAARDLVEALVLHATQEKFQYRHKWKDGDIVVWDNRVTMHRALNDYDGFRRVMHRVSVSAG